jgi:hypothetical protein
MALSVLLDVLELQRIGNTVGKPLSQLAPHLFFEDILRLYKHTWKSAPA